MGSSNRGIRYLIRCVNEHVEFRIPEIKAVASMLKIPLKWVEAPGEDPFVVVELQNEKDARNLTSRCMLIRSVFELWGQGGSMEELHTSLQNIPTKFEAHIQDPSKTFKINVDTYNKRLTLEDKLDKIESFVFLPFKGKVKLKDPHCILQLIENYGLDVNNIPDTPEKLYFGRWISDGPRELIERFSLKERLFIGNTSMDPQLAFIMSNMAQVEPGQIIGDPFVGTGSTLVAAALHGAYVWGWDIDYMTLHAQSKPSRYNEKKRKGDESIRNNLRQYNLEHKYLDVAVMDSANSQWRPIPFLEAIITDPPYGIRESLARVGTHKDLPGDTDFSQFPEHFPQKISYNVSDIYIDLLNFAAIHLVIGGRLVFWIPIIREQYHPSQIPGHPCLQLEANTEQVLTSHSSRRLITLTKLRHPQANELATSNISFEVGDFREKFFQASGISSRHERLQKKCTYPRDKRGQSLTHRLGKNKSNLDKQMKSLSVNIVEISDSEDGCNGDLIDTNDSSGDCNQITREIKM